MSALSGTDSLVFGGAAILLVLGGLIFGELLGGGGVGLVGALAGEVLLFAWLARPAASRPVQFPTGTASVVVAALVVAIVILELADLIEVLRNFNLLTGQGIASLLSRLSHWVGAAMMALGVLAAWGPAPKAPTT